jgi:hypothetical protein
MGDDILSVRSTSREAKYALTGFPELYQRTDCLDLSGELDSRNLLRRSKWCWIVSLPL